jgi:hypothetical protein
MPELVRVLPKVTGERNGAVAVLLGKHDPILQKHCAGSLVMFNSALNGHHVARRYKRP